MTQSLTADSANPSIQPRRVWLAVLPATFALLAAWPSLDGRFVNGDDERLILNHVLVNRPSPANAWILVSRLTDDLYQPAAMISFQINYALAGADPTGRFPVSPRSFHCTNLLLHTVNSMLLFLVLRRLVGCMRIALLAALLFAVHPFAVEAYAWINGRMILLATTFGLLTAWAVTTSGIRLRPERAIGVILLWALSLTSKIFPTGPVVLAVSDLHQVNRRSPGRIALHVILLMMACGATWLATWSTFDVLGSEALTETRIGPRLAHLVMAMRYYLENYFWPVRLAAWSPPTTETSLSSLPVLIGMGECVLLAAAIFVLRKYSRPACFGLLALLVLLAPFLAAGTTRYFLAADRYMYLPMIGLNVALAALLVKAIDVIRLQLGKVVSWKVIGLPTAAILIASLVWSRQLCETWHDSVSRDRRVSEVWPDHPEVFAQLAKAHLYEQDVDSAMQVFHESIERWPTNPRLAAAAGDILRIQGDLPNAERWLRVALEGMPDHARTRYQFAVTLEEQGRAEEAKVEYERILSRNSRFLPAVTSLARYYRRAGDASHAEEYFRRAVEINPYHLESLRYLTGVSVQQNDRTAAIKYLDQILELSPEERDARLHRASLLVPTQPAVAEREYRAMLAREPSDLDATIGLHLTLVRLGRYSELPRLWEDPSFITLAVARAWRIWALVLAEKVNEARSIALAIPASAPEKLFADWALVFAALKASDFESARLYIGDAARAARLEKYVDEMNEMIVQSFSRLPERTANSPAAFYVAALSFYAKRSAVDWNAANLVCEKILETTSDAFWKRAVHDLQSAITASSPPAS